MRINIVKLASYLPNYLRSLKNAIEYELGEREFQNEIEMIAEVQLVIEKFKMEMYLETTHRLNTVDFSARIKYIKGRKNIIVVNSTGNLRILKIEAV